MTTNRNSRLNKFEKRRRNTKLINYSLGLATVLILFLVGIWLFGGGDEITESSTEESTEKKSYFIEVEEEDEEGSSENQANSANENDEENNEENDQTLIDEENSEIETSKVEPSDDNVKEALTGNWPPIGTTQTGPHTTKYENGSQDRIEIRKATSMVTGIPEDDMIEWWVGRGGEQQVIATVSDRAESETYRVYLSWVDNEGWQPTKIETLIKNDKKKLIKLLEVTS